MTSNIFSLFSHPGCPQLWSSRPPLAAGPADGADSERMGFSVRLTASPKPRAPHPRILSIQKGNGIQMSSLMNRGVSLGSGVWSFRPACPLPACVTRLILLAGARRFYKDSLHCVIWASQLGLRARLLAWGGQLGVHLEPPPCQGGPSSPTC